MNMFKNQEAKKIPASLHECTEGDPVSTNLWVWARRLETFGIIVKVVILILGFINSIQEANIEVETGVYYKSTHTEFNWEVFLLGYANRIVYAISFYCVCHTFALLIGSAASVVLNTRVSADVALLTASGTSIRKFNTHSEQGENSKSKPESNKNTEEESPTVSEDISEDLKKLNRLFCSGLITKEAYETRKKLIDSKTESDNNN